MSRLALILSIFGDARIRRRIARESQLDIHSDDEEYTEKYRLNRRLFDQLVAELTPYMKRVKRRSELSPRNKVKIALSFYASGSHQKLIRKCGGANVSQQTVSRVIIDVTRALNHPDIQRKYIRFPKNIQERERIKSQFYEKYQIPGVIGCIDCMHVALIRPNKDEEIYLNRENYHSRNVQIICDNDLNIQSVDSSFGGSAHDFDIFNEHPIRNQLEDLANGGETVCLLGGSNYELREYMMTPIINPTPGSPEEHYTTIHSSVLNRVERTIAELRARWRCLEKLYYSPSMVAEIINACCVLHNVCNKGRLPPQEMESNDSLVSPKSPIEETTDSSLNPSFQRGLEVRNHLISNLWPQESNN